jgi:multiple sugar transport system permease protein
MTVAERTLTTRVQKGGKRKDLLPYLLLLPAGLIIVLVMGYPLAYGITLAFTDASLIEPETHFVGLKNFAALIQDPQLGQAVLISILWTTYCVATQIGLGLGLALLLHRRIFGRSLFRTVLLAPWASPAIGLAVVFSWLYDPMSGYLTYFFRVLGLPKILFLADPLLALASVSLPYSWRGFPFVMIVLLAALESIDPTLYEIASIDGAGAWAKFRFITIPNLKPLLMLMTLLLSTWALGSFDTIWIMTRGGPVNSTSTLAVYGYYNSFFMHRLGYGSAIFLVLLLVEFSLSILYLRLLRAPRNT